MAEAQEPRLAGYDLRGILHVGETSTLYDAEQTELGRAAVVKVVSGKRADDEESVERFLREARALASLRHPNIVAIYDLGRLGDGRPYTIMERLEGQTLAQHLEAEHELPLERIADVVDALGAALGALHDKGIVHRNVKPENVFLAQEDGREVVKLIDFGLVAPPRREGERRLTRVGEALGTPCYMAPESLDDAPLDARADVYALATIAYELIVGEPPFDHEDPLRLLAIKAAEDAPPLAAKLDQTPPPELEEAVGRGLARDRDARTPSATELAARIRAGIAAWTSPPARRSTRPPPRPRAPSEDHPSVPMNRGLHASAGVILGGVLLLAAVVWIVGGRSDPAETAQPDRAGAEPAATHDAPPAEREEPPPDRTAEQDDLPAGRSAPEPGRSRPRRRRGRAAEEEPATPVATLAPESVRAAREATDRGTQALVRGRIPEAIRQFRDATNHDPRHAAAWRGLGLANERLGRIPEAIEAYDEYLSLSPNARDAAVVRDRLASLRP